MTWAKFGTEFDDEVAHAGLSDAAYRTHSEAIKYLYGIESADLRIPKHQVRRIAGSPDYETGVKELVGAGFWRETADAYVVVHHAAVIRESLQAQRAQRARNRQAQRAFRQRHPAPDQAPEISAYVSADVSADPDRQTDSFPPAPHTGDPQQFNGRI